MLCLHWSVLNIYRYFDAIYTSTELNLDKRTPEIYKQYAGNIIYPLQILLYMKTHFLQYVLPKVQAAMLLLYMTMILLHIGKKLKL